MTKKRPAADAIELFDVLVARVNAHPEDPDAWMKLASDLADSRLWCWAYLAAEEAVRQAPGWGQPVWLMADCLARVGLARDAVELLEAHERLDRQNANSLYAAARLGVRADDPEVALPLLIETLKLAPDHAAALGAQLDMLRMAEMSEEAERFERALEEGASPNALRALARDRIARGEPENALSYLARVPADDPATQTLKARALLTMGRLSEAADQASRALAGDPSNDTARRWLVDVEHETRAMKLVPAPVRGNVRDRLEPVKGRVLHLVTTSLPYVQAGYTLRSQAIARAQAEVGLDPYFVTPPGFPGSANAGDIDYVDRIPYHRLFPGMGDAPLDELLEMYAEHAAALVERLRPKVLHPATGFVNGAVALGLGKAYDIPVVYEVRGFLEDSWVARKPWASHEADRYAMRRDAETRCMEGADIVVTLGEAMRDEIMTRGIAADKVIVVPNAVDSERFGPTVRDPVLGKRLKIGPGDVVVGYVSTIRRHEGIHVLIESLADLITRGHRVIGLIVGDGPELTALREKAAELGVADHVVFTGAVPHEEVLRYYSLMDVFVVPRTNERVNRLVTPLKPYEAMAAGNVVVVSALPALREMVIDEETGLWFTPEDATDLSEKLEKLITRPQYMSELAGRGNKWVREQRTWTCNALTYREIYERIV